jgi:hypothetical protein
MADRDPQAAARLKPMRLHATDNMLERHRGLAAASLAAPLLGAAAAFAATVSRLESRSPTAADLPQEGAADE